MNLSNNFLINLTRHPSLSSSSLIFFLILEFLLQSIQKQSLFSTSFLKVRKVGPMCGKCGAYMVHFKIHARTVGEMYTEMCEKFLGFLKTLLEKSSRINLLIIFDQFSSLQVSNQDFSARIVRFGKIFS